MIYWKSMALTLFLYSLVPFSLTLAWLRFRLGGIPVTYLPFMIFLALNFITYFFLLPGRLNHHALKTALWMGAFIFHTILATLILWFNNELESYTDTAIDIIMYLFYWIVAYLGILLFLGKQSTPKQADQMLTIFTITLAFIVVFGGLRYFLIDLGQTMPFPNFFNPLPWRLFEALLLVFFAAIAAGWYDAEKKTRYLVSFGILALGVLLSESRTAYVALAVLLVYFSYRNHLWNIFSKRGIFLIGSALVFVAIIGFVASDHIMARLEKMDGIFLYMSLDFDQAVQQNHLVRRIGMIVASLEMIKTHLLLGVGLGKENYFSNFPQYYLNFFHVGRPHNQYLMVASATGLPGIALFLGFLLSILNLGRRALKKWRHHPVYAHKIRYLMLGNILIMIMMIGYEFETEPFIWMIWAVSTGYLATLLSMKKTQEKE